LFTAYSIFYQLLFDVKDYAVREVCNTERG